MLRTERKTKFWTNITFMNGTVWSTNQTRQDNKKKHSIRIIIIKIIIIKKNSLQATIIEIKIMVNIIYDWKTLIIIIF